jgi:hypothetical protein
MLYPSVSAGNLAIIDRLEEDPSELSSAMDLGRLLRQLAARVREGVESQQGFVASMSEAARASRVMRTSSQNFRCTWSIRCCKSIDR